MVRTSSMKFPPQEGFTMVTSSGSLDFVWSVDLKRNLLMRIYFLISELIISMPLQLLESK
jgi:acetate kinase